MNIITVVFVAFAVCLLLLMWAVLTSRGWWHSTGKTSIETTKLSNGYTKEQGIYEEVDLQREGRTRWSKYSGYTLVAPNGKREYIDTTDYGM